MPEATGAFRREAESGIDIPILRKARFLLKPARYKVLHGGRGAGKS